jgi:REP element-mobilizing transposase RayT
LPVELTGSSINLEVSMGYRLRWIIPNRVYEATIRTVDRQFSFKPNHRADNPLLEESFPANALDLRNDIIPEPSIINIIGAAVGRALKRFPIQLHCFEVNITHIHMMFSVTEEQRGNLPGFLRAVHSVIATNVNKTWDREGHLFGARARIHICLDEGAAEKHLLYAMTNTVKDNLVETVSASPFFSTYRFQAEGKPLRYWYIDWDAYHTAGGKQKKSHRPKDYLVWTEWECTPLPEQADMPEHRRRTWLRQQVREIEEQCKKERKEKGKTVIGKKQIYAVDPRDRPDNPKKSGQEPLCHASDPELTEEYKEDWRTFMDKFIEASADYRNGYFKREFPDGSFRPPLVSIYTASGL